MNTVKNKQETDKVNYRSSLLELKNKDISHNHYLFDLNFWYKALHQRLVEHGTDIFLLMKWIKQILADIRLTYNFFIVSADMRQRHVHLVYSSFKPLKRGSNYSHIASLFIVTKPRHRDRNKRFWHTNVPFSSVGRHTKTDDFFSVQLGGRIFRN